MIVVIKYLLSFLKKNWDINDYPFDIYLNKNAGEDKVKYGARVLKWVGMVGHGESKEAAFESLKNHFIVYKENNKLPRPGTSVPLRFASTDKIDEYEDIAVDFFRKIFNRDYYKGFYSDKSTLIELEIFDDSVDSKDIIIDRVNNTYQVDISNVYDEPLWRVFQEISNKPIKST